LVFRYFSNAKDKKYRNRGDGKTVKGSFNSRTQTSLHMVSAWAAENRLVLAQVKTQDKSNEITAIPCLLELIALKGSIVTIDAADYSPRGVSIK
jgi:hypothetical protein